MWQDAPDFDAVYESAMRLIVEGARPRPPGVSSRAAAVKAANSA
jgi:hypothetical protein